MRRRGLFPAAGQARCEAHSTTWQASNIWKIKVHKGVLKFGGAAQQEARQADLCRVSSAKADAVTLAAVVEACEKQREAVRSKDRSLTRGERSRRAAGPPVSRADRNAFLWGLPEVAAIVQSGGATVSEPHQSIWPLLRLALPAEDIARQYHAGAKTLVQLYSTVLRLNEEDPDYLALQYVRAVCAWPLFSHCFLHCAGTLSTESTTAAGTARKASTSSKMCSRSFSRLAERSRGVRGGTRRSPSGR